MIRSKQLIFPLTLTLLTTLGAFAVNSHPASAFFENKESAPLFANVTPEMQGASYWIESMAESERVILNPSEIAAYNQEIGSALPGIVVNLADYPSYIEQSQLLQQIKSVTTPTSPLYLNGQPLPAAYFEALQSKLNLGAIQNQVAVRYGFTVKRTHLRTYPTAEPVVGDPAHTEEEAYQETALNPAQPVIILHQTEDAQWFYLQTPNYRAWASAADIATAPSREQWLAYLDTPQFLVVTGADLTLPIPNQDSALLFEMGATLPVKGPIHPKMPNYTIILPQRDSEGLLQFITVVLPKSAAVHQGYLPYTRANIITQAFKMLGRSYDWGGLAGSVDCSAFTMNIFRCFGYQFPRNSGEQARLPGSAVTFDSPDSDVRIGMLSHLRPGAVLSMKGHVMIYLGMVNGNPYIIHALSSYGVPDPQGNYQKTYVLKVLVTELSLPRYTGQSLLASLTTGKNIGEPIVEGQSQNRERWGNTPGE